MARVQKKRYSEELEGRGDAVQKMVQLASHGGVTLLYSSKEEHLNNAVALKEYIEKKLNSEGAVAGRSKKRRKIEWMKEEIF
jgi:hypothetical protein